MSNKELYKKSFSKLHTSIKLEVDNMKSVNVKMVCKSVLTIWLVSIAVIGFSCGATYAVTGGKTANPIVAIQILINGVDISSTLTPDNDGNYIVDLNKGDDLVINKEDTSVTLKTKEGISQTEDNENIKLKISSNDGNVDIIVNNAKE